MGGAAHADDLRTAAVSKESIMQQWNKFTTSRNLKPNSSKNREITQQLPGESQLKLSDQCVNNYVNKCKVPGSMVAA